MPGEDSTREMVTGVGRRLLVRQAVGRNFEQGTADFVCRGNWVSPRIDPEVKGLGSLFATLRQHHGRTGSVDVSEGAGARSRDETSRGCLGARKAGNSIRRKEGDMGCEGCHDGGWQPTS